MQFFHLTPFFRRAKDGRGLWKGTLEGEGGRGGRREGGGGGGGIRGGGTATDAIDLHDPVRNGWEAS